MGKSKNNNKKGDHGMKEDMDFLSDPVFAAALARTDVMPKGWADGSNVSAKVRKSVNNPALAMALACPNSSSSGGLTAKLVNDGDSDNGEDAQESEYEEEELVEESDDASQTLGEQDSDCTPSVRQNAPVQVNTENGNSQKNVQNSIPRPYVSFFAGNRKLGNGLKLEKYELEEGPIKLTEDDVSTDEWKNSLVGYFGGKFPRKTALQQLVQSWKQKVTLHFHSNGWIIFKFENQEGRDNTLQDGPYMVFGRPLLLKILPEFFTFGYEDLSCFPIWVQLRNLPVEAWNVSALSKLCSRIGKPVYSDKLTVYKDRVTFARVLIEVDVAKPVTRVLEIIMPNGCSLSCSFVRVSGSGRID